MTGASVCAASTGLVAEPGQADSSAEAAAPAATAGTSVELSLNRSSDDQGVQAGYYQFVRDGRRVEVTLRNGQVTNAKMDGQDVPAERVRLDGQSLAITDEDGNAVFTHEFASNDAGTSRRTRQRISVQSMGGGGADSPTVRRFYAPRAAEAHAFAMSAQAQAAAELERARAARAEVEAQARALSIEPPSVMIGVQMAPAPDVLCGHLGIEPGSAVLVSAVHEGLPAHAAGLRPYDVIVGIDGSDDVTDQAIRERLRQMNAGDSVSLAIVHRGERRTVTVSPVAYDAEVLRSAKVEAIASARMTQGAPTGGMSHWFSGDRNIFALAPSHPDSPRAPSAPGTPIGGEEQMIIQIEPLDDASHGSIFRGLSGIAGMEGMDERVERAIGEALQRIESARSARGPASGGPAGWPADIEQMREQMQRLERMMQRVLEQQHGEPSRPAVPVPPSPPVGVPEKSS